METRKSRIESKLHAGLAPVVLQIQDESHKHSVPAGAESHFNVMVVSDRFRGQGRVDRHRVVYTLLDHEMNTGLHALTLTLLTPEEHQGRAAIASPACRGGGKGG